MFSTRAIFGSVVILTVANSIAVADDWTANKLRGQVIQLVNNEWVPLRRGDVVPDTRYVATMATGRVELVRGNETVSLEPNTRIRIYDKEGAKPFTTVKQDFGTVAVEAEVQQVQHFAVQTRYLAAVVKGTRFSVTVGKTGAKVDVRRGHVEVDDAGNHTHTTLSVGQSAVVDKVSTAGTITVSGSGTLPPVLDKAGKPVSGPDPKALAHSSEQAAKTALKAAEDAQKRADALGTKAAKDAAKEAAKDAKDAAKAADKAEKAAGGNGSGGGSSSGGDPGGKSDKGDKSDKENGNEKSGGSGNGDGDGGKKGGDGNSGNSGSSGGVSGGGSGGDGGSSGGGGGGNNGGGSGGGDHGNGGGGDNGKGKDKKDK